MIFSAKAKEEWNVTNVVSDDMERYVAECAKAYHGRPEWTKNADDNITTVNFAKFICSEIAKLSTLGMTVQFENETPRGEAIQKRIDEAMRNVRQWIEYAAAYGTIILKPSLTSVDAILPENFIVTDQKNGEVTGIIFLNQIRNEDGTKWYTRLEYHRFVNDLYVITNKCYVGATNKDFSTKIVIEDTPWNGLKDEIGIRNLDRPLYGVLKMPSGNSVDVNSALAMPIFADAMQELKDLDVAYSRNNGEIFDSEKIVLLDSDMMTMPGDKVSLGVGGFDRKKKQLKLPHYVRNVMGNGNESIYHEINPQLNTETRIKGINTLLSQIGFKCGFSNGYFVFNESTGFSTATQVTADQARTIQLVSDVRKMIDACMIDLIKAINVFEDLYGTTGHVTITDTTSTNELDRMIHLHFEPIYTNAEEDRMRALQLTNSGYYPKWYYLHMFEGLSEEEAKALTEEAAPKMTGLFAE